MRIGNRVVFAALIAALLAAGCGGDSGTSETGSTTVAPVSASPPTDVSPDVTEGAEATPGDLGDRIGDNYVAAIEDVVALLAERPKGSAARASVAELKESYVQALVELGRQREALAPTDRDEVDARIRSRVNGISQDLFAEYQAVLSDYGAIDAEIAELVSSFNIITQYANFDLLSEQSPEEATRLLGD